MKLSLGALLIGGALITITIISFCISELNSNTNTMNKYIQNSSSSISNGENLISNQTAEINGQSNTITSQNNQIQNLQNQQSQLQTQLSELQNKYKKKLNSIGPDTSSTTPAYINAAFINCIKNITPSTESEVNQLISYQNQVENLIYENSLYNTTAYDPTINSIENQMLSLENTILNQEG